MGVIFTFDQIERGHVPKPQAFDNIVSMLRGRLPHVPGFCGGVLCGSVGKRERIYRNRRSDIDGIAVYEPAHANAMKRAMQAIHEEAAKYHVPLDFRTIRRDLAETAAHGISMDFARHLADAAKYDDGEIGTNPLPLFAYRTRNKADEARDYLARKLQTFTYLENQIPTLSEADLCRFLRQIMEAPVHAARKILSMRPHGIVPSDAKIYVIPAYRDHISAPSSKHELLLFNRMICADEDYTRALPKHLKERERTEYAIQIGTIYNLIPDCIELLALILGTLARA